MADVIHPDQTYTVPGRSIFDNLFLVRDLLELGHRDGLSFALLSLDQEKAFDRVDHGYLLSTLQAFGFGPQFEDDRLVLREPELWLALSAYADDVRLVVQDPGDLAHFMMWQAGVATLFSLNLRPEVLGVTEAVPGHLLHLRVRMERLVVNFVNIYAPTTSLKQPQFYQRVSDFLGTLDSHECLAHSSNIRPAPFSDHHLATITASLHAERPGLAYWHFNNSLLEDEGFVTSFREFWLAWREQRRAFPSARRWWDLGKVHAKLFCRDYTRGTSRRRNAVIEQLEREVLEMERHLAASPEDPFLCGACREKREELQALEDHRARGAFIRSRIRLLREMDRGSCFFYALEKTRGAKKHVTCLLAEDGAPLTDPVEMCGRARDFYTSLFSPDLTDPGTCKVLW
ncbi:unnamed protein product [Caretta caretta]